MIDHNEASDLIRAAVARIVTEGGLVQAEQGETVERASIKMLQWAWCQAVRAEWQAFVDADPELKAQHAVALELMREDGYGSDRMPEPICGLPGAKPPICRVDGLESVSVDYLMNQVTPLSAIYLNKVRLVQSAAARVAKALAEEAAKEDPKGGWPIKTAAGEVFNSIEDMKASPNEFVRGLADSMVKAQEEREKAAAQMMTDAGMAACHPSFEPGDTEKLIREGIPVVGAVNERVRREYKAEEHAVRNVLQPEDPASCWQYFQFDGPVSYEVLHIKYRARIAGIRPTDNHKLAAEISLQYQNCLREIGKAMMNGTDNAS